MIRTEEQRRRIDAMSFIEMEEVDRSKGDPASAWWFDNPLREIDNIAKLAGFLEDQLVRVWELVDEGVTTSIPGLSDAVDSLRRRTIDEGVWPLYFYGAESGQWVPLQTWRDLLAARW